MSPPGAEGPDAALSLADLEGFDPGAPLRGTERRFCCPLPTCADKRQDAAHRSLAVNVRTGAWNCHRCGGKGLLREFWTPLEPRGSTSAATYPARRDRGRGGLRRNASAMPALPPSPAPIPLPADLQQRLHQVVGAGSPGALRSLPATAGDTYLSRRGLPGDFCQSQGVRFSPAFHGRPAVAFSIRGPGGELVAVHGRYIDGRDNPRMRTEGERRAGVFATPGALPAAEEPCPAGAAAWAPPIVITEAPIDALTLAFCGVPAVALCGSHGLPAWLLDRCAFRTVYAAFDADDAGDKAAVELAAALALYGSVVRRLRPEGGKDWNEIHVQRGFDHLRSYLATRMPVQRPEGTGTTTQPSAPAAAPPENEEEEWTPPPPPVDLPAEEIPESDFSDLRDPWEEAESSAPPTAPAPREWNVFEDDDACS